MYVRDTDKQVVSSSSWDNIYGNRFRYNLYIFKLLCVCVCVLLLFDCLDDYKSLMMLSLFLFVN